MARPVPLLGGEPVSRKETLNGGEFVGALTLVAWLVLLASVLARILGLWHPPSWFWVGLLEFSVVLLCLHYWHYLEKE